MIYKGHKRTYQGNLVKLVMVIFGLAAGSAVASAQQVTTLIQFTNVWKYDQSGLELGTAWRTNDYDDSTWPSGQGLLGFEDVIQPYTVHAPLNTSLIISATVTSYYFRTTFQFSGETNGLSLFATNLVDDGCVVYLNGFEAGRVRVPANQNATTTASSGPTTEGQLDVLNIAPPRLRQGANLLAVEVHQSATTSADVMWGMKLMAIEQLPLNITNQPQDQFATVGDTVILQVGVSGGPAFYQWQRDGVNLVNGGSISGATSNVLRIVNAQANNSGSYRVMVTNAVTTSLFSSPAALAVNADRIGPTLVSAVIRLDAGSTNQIVVTFSETVPNQFSTDKRAVNPANYRLTVCGTTNTAPITNATASGTLVLLRVSNTNWNTDGCYILTVNNIPDIRGNVIAPDSQVAVARPLQLALLASDAEWSFHASAAFDSGIFDEDWTSTNYVEGLWWAQGNGIFYGGPASVPQCLGSPQTSAGFQPEPILFRTTFNWPTNLGSAAQLEPDIIIDDGAVLYLNGVEIWRSNVPAAVTRLSTASRSTATIATPTCVTNISIAVTNLLPGTNWLAAGVVQPASDFASDMVFGLRLSATVLVSGPLPESPAPTLNLSPEDTDSVRLWWTGGGYALESATNLTDNSASYPLGPWLQVTNMSNPYTNSLAAPARFFRLKK